MLAVTVLSAANLAVTSTEACFFRRTIRVGEARLDTSAVGAFFAGGTVAFSGADKTALLVHTSITRRAVMVTQADNRLTTASHSWISPEVRLAFTSGCVAFGPAGGVQATLEMVAGVLAHWLTETVRVAGEVTRAVPIPVRTRVGMPTALAVWIPNEAICTDALVSTGHVDALC